MKKTLVLLRLYLQIPHNSHMSRARTWVSEHRTPLVADGRGRLAFNGWHVMPSGY